MSVNLNTLKNVKGIWSNGNEGIGSRHTHTEELRQEAINHIKDLRNNFDENLPFECRDTIGLILWIKYFFNISDKDIIKSKKEVEKNE